MTLLGKVIKNTLALKTELEIGSLDARQKQINQLHALLIAAKSTAFGKYYDFASILKSEDSVKEFQSRVPIHDYGEIQSNWWSQQYKFPDIAWPGKPEFYALTSGTTGSESKRIPVTKDFLKSMKQVGLDQLVELSHMEISEKVFASEALIISSSANLLKKNGKLEGEISGINVYDFPFWYDLFYRPGKDIARIDSWDERTDIIAKQAAEWNIGTIAGIPSWVQKCLHKILERNRVEYVDDLWPNASVFISGGVAFGTYEKSFRSLFKNEIKVVDSYLASEGFFAYGAPSDSLEMKLALSHGYFYEFVPFDQRGFDSEGNLKDDPVTLTIGEVEADEEYALVVTTCAGSWRYLIGDTLKFTDTNKNYIRLTGRTKFFLNVVGSQLSEEKLDNVIDHINKEYNTSVNEYSVACIHQDGKYLHQWVLVTDDNLVTEKLEDKIDSFLHLKQKNYRIARSKVLEGVRVLCISQKNYEAWLKKHKELGGQIKVEKVMSEEDIKKYISFLSS